MRPPLSVLCVPVACPKLYPRQDSIWKSWRPLVSLLQISGGHVAEFIGTFEKTAGEVLCPMSTRFRRLSVFMGTAVPKFDATLIFALQCSTPTLCGR